MTTIIRPWEEDACPRCGSDEVEMPIGISGNPEDSWECKHCGLEFIVETKREIVDVMEVNCIPVQECKHCKKMGVVHKANRKCFCNYCGENDQP